MTNGALKAKVRERIDFLRREIADRMTDKVASATVERVAVERAKDSVDRAYVIDNLKRVVEIGLGDRTVPKLRMAATKTTTKGGKVTIKQEQVEIEDYDVNLPAATRALELLGRALGEPFDGSGDTQRRGEVSTLARSANDPAVIELVRKYATGNHPSRRFALPKTKESA